MPEIRLDTRSVFDGPSTGRATVKPPTSDELFERAFDAQEREAAAIEEAEAKAEQRATAIRTLTNVAEGDVPRHGDPMAAVEAARTLLEII